MNKRKQFILLLFLIIGFFILFRCYQTQSVLNVLNQRNDAILDSMRMIHRNGVKIRKRFEINRLYVKELYKIDASHCPKKFQLAWLDYIQTCERVQKMPGKILIDLVVVSATGHIFPLANEIPKIQKTADELELAEQNLERVALEYDVRVIHK